MKRIGILVIVLVLFITGCSVKELFVRENEQVESITGKVNVEMTVRDYGTIKLELDADTAPITVSNFVHLVKKGFYDGLTFHRIVANFMIQGGDPDHNGTGGNSIKIKGEFGANGIPNEISHTRGVISMARGDDYNSASSQFFIVHQDSTHLNGKYAAFGHVTEGMEVVDKIVADVNPTEEDIQIPYEKQPVIESMKIIEEIEKNWGMIKRLIISIRKILLVISFF